MIDNTDVQNYIEKLAKVVDGGYIYIAKQDTLNRKKRNSEIMMMWKMGVSVAEIAQNKNMLKTSIYKIIRKEKKNAGHQK